MTIGNRLIALALVSGLAYWGYSNWMESVETAERTKAKDAQAILLKTRVSDVAAKFNAVVDWPNTLSHGEHLRLSPVLTVELQDLWQTGKPILFFGTVLDIERISPATTRLSVEHAIDQPNLFLGTILRLRLECDATATSPILDMARDPNRLNLQSDIAVVALVSAVVASSERDSQGERTPVLTGVGTCVDLVPIPEHVGW